MRLCGLIRLFGLAVVVGAALAAGPAAADEIRWQVDPGRGWKTAGESGRPMLIYATMDGCIHCKRMEKSTFTDAKLQTQLNEQFVPIYLPYEQHEKLVSHWRIESFPTTLLVAPNGHVIARIKGFVAPDELLRQTQAAAKSNKPQEPAALAAQTNAKPLAEATKSLDASTSSSPVVAAEANPVKSTPVRR